MGSQTDLDQGGTYRPRTLQWLGPSIGGQPAYSAVLRVTAGGTTTVQLGNAVVVVSTTSAVTLQLPVFKGNTTGGAGAVPGGYAFPETLTILDTSGAPNVTILPGSGETISGLSTASLSTPNGAFVLQPDPINGGSTVVS